MRGGAEGQVPYGREKEGKYRMRRTDGDGFTKDEMG